MKKVRRVAYALMFGLAAASAAGLDASGPSVPRSAGMDFKTDGAGTITGYTETAATVVIPPVIDGKPVTAIGTRAFRDTLMQVLTT